MPFSPWRLDAVDSTKKCLLWRLGESVLVNLENKKHCNEDESSSRRIFFLLKTTKKKHIIFLSHQVALQLIDTTTILDWKSASLEALRSLSKKPAPNLRNLTSDEVGLCYVFVPKVDILQFL